MDSIKHKLNEKNISSELLEKIEQHLSKLKSPSILITSNQITHSIIINGIQKLYENKISFIHTLGCPYCYSDKKEIDSAIRLSHNDNNIIAVNNDALKIIGSNSSLEQCNAKVINKEIDCIDLAKENPNKQVILFSCGFETTIPNIAGVVIKAKEENISNLKIILSNKLTPPAIRNLLNKHIKIDGYFAPGDLSILVGLQTWNFITEESKIPVVVSGFETIDILNSIETLLNMLVNKEYQVINNYSALVNEKGNPLAQEITYKVFAPKTTEWYGYGLIPFSGLTFNPEYADFDALKDFDFPEEEQKPTECICKEVLSLKKSPKECSLYQNICRPETPQDTCMSLENALCSIFYRTETQLVPDLKSCYRVVE